MRQIIIESLAWYTVVSIVLYLIMSFINLTFNVTQWAECYRVITGILEGVICLAMLVRYEERMNNLNRD
jgi:hypothetical protein